MVAADSGFRVAASERPPLALRCRCVAAFEVLAGVSALRPVKCHAPSPPAPRTCPAGATGTAHLGSVVLAVLLVLLVLGLLGAAGRSMLRQRQTQGDELRPRFPFAV